MLAHAKRAALLARLACVSTHSRSECEAALPAYQFDKQTRDMFAEGGAGLREAPLKSRAAVAGLLESFSSMMEKTRNTELTAETAEKRLAALKDADSPFPGCFLDECKPCPTSVWHGEDDEEVDGFEPQVLRCWRVLCVSPGCTESVCLQHGWGDGEGEGEGFAISDMSYDSRNCHADGCNSHFCPLHWFRETACCECCSAPMHAEAALGHYNRNYEAHYCQKHPVAACTVVLSQLPRVPQRFGRPPGPDEQCSIMCCPSCLPAHRCGEHSEDYM